MALFWKKRNADTAPPAGTMIHLDPSHKKATCPKCKTVHTGNDIWNRNFICPNCGKYMSIGAKERLAMVLDEASFEPWFEEVEICDPL